VQYDRLAWNRAIDAHYFGNRLRSDFPNRFGSIEDARTHCQRFFDWYNTEHRHSGIGFMIPETVHYGRAAEAHKQRAAALDAAFDRHAKRFKGAAPQPPALPTAAWINSPKKEPSGKTSDRDCTVISFRSLSHSY
jgi:putative transposase